MIQMRLSANMPDSAAPNLTLNQPVHKYIFERHI